MVIAIIVVALAMIVGGVTAIFTGAESIVLERGWSAVIAGSIVATGGALLVALALLLRELQRLPQRLETVVPDAQEPWRDAPHVDAPVVAPVLAAAPFSAETIQSLEPRDVTPPLARDEVPVAAVERAERLPRRPAPRIDPVEATARAVSAGPRFGPPQVVPEAYVVPAVAAEAPEPAQERQKEPELRAERETGETSAPEPVSEPKAEEPVVPMIGTAETMRSVFPDFSPRDRIAPVDAEPAHEEGKPPEDVVPPVGEEPAPAEEVSPPAVVQPPIEEPELALNPDRAAAGTPVVKAEQTSGPAADVEPEPPSKPAAEDKPAPGPAQEPANVTPTVVGTYSSGGNVYVMYADGSIEADTPDGVFRFSSLDELKAYIASGSQGRGAEADKRRPSPVI